MTAVNPGQDAARRVTGDKLRGRAFADDLSDSSAPLSPIRVFRNSPRGILNKNLYKAAVITRLAMEQGLLKARKDLESVWERFFRNVGSGPVPDVARSVRPEVAESWSLARVDPGIRSAPTRPDVDVSTRWCDSRLRQPVADIADELQRITDDGEFVVAVTDESATILWTSGCRAMRRRAERMNFEPGGDWAEHAIGTNALGMALRTDRPSTVFSAEHTVEGLHDWVCYSAPIHDPCGRQLGAVDLSSTWDRATGLGLAAARLLASAIEARLRDTCNGAQDAAARVRLSCLGRAELLVEGSPVHATLRQFEILALLALRPAGLSPGELAAEIYGDRRVAPATLKSEVSHVRRVLGGQLGRRRYALLEPVRCDAVNVFEALSRGDVVGAAERYGGPLLPESEAPGILEARDQLDVAVRDAVLGSDSSAAALALSAAKRYDCELHEHALRLLAPSDSRRHLVIGRLRAAEG
ncbi:transcriptional regulator [Candidatus Mycobacterium methanotrophicum]|uniref:Transcriptional regulator n=1 Tax=Candidatus Mycobacterium methanotrophicum TaxID=2943498 RepID=A0ABY4QNW9_9MYCO|nr:transcriptional regulator [Candidatus Mycobacterium methanotrophicum]UQX11656.1 transcriptional regulator [Candidatus Mycobacterium methanotrophicum]